MSGSLVLVATPIGNLGDISFRATETLRTADVIACEDTRHTRKLLNHLEIRSVPVMAVHEHNEVGAAAELVDRIANGETVALVTDAGMPAISDPGERVVAAVAAAGLRVSVIPGPSAVPAALAISGLPTERFCFEGFLPRKASDRKERMAALVTEARTSVLYEAPHRLGSTVRDLCSACGESRRVVLVRELTKLYEEVWRGTLGELSHRLEAQTVKGECVLVLDGAPLLSTVEVTDDEIIAALKAELAQGASRRDAAATVTERYSQPKRRIYDLATQVKSS